MLPDTTIVPMSAKPELTIALLQQEAAAFAKIESTYPEPSLYGVTDGKAVGTYIEQKFNNYLALNYNFKAGNSASGIDLPGLGVDIKVTSLKQPQSSCPFKSPRQKIFGLGYNLLVFVYTKKDDDKCRTAVLHFDHTVFVALHRTADYQTTSAINKILKSDDPISEDIVAYMMDRNFPIDDITATQIAEELIKAGSVEEGYLTISNALQWRLNYKRAIKKAGSVEGVEKVY